MTDAAYCLRQTERERKALARMSRYKKSGSKTNYVRLPQTYMTEKEIRKMHGEIVTISFGKRYSKEEFLKFDNDMRKLYIQNLIDKYNARRKDIANMLGLSYGGFVHMCHDLFPVNPFKNEGKGAKPTKDWLDFVSGKLDEPKPVDDFAPPAEIIVEKKPEPTPEPPKVQSATTKVQEMAPIDGNNLVLESYRVRYTGNIVLACAEILKVLRHDTDYVINIEVYPATQTPTCLPF